MTERPPGKRDNEVVPKSPESDEVPGQESSVEETKRAVEAVFGKERLITVKQEQKVRGGVNESFDKGDLRGVFQGVKKLTELQRAGYPLAEEAKVQVGEATKKGLELFYEKEKGQTPSVEYFRYLSYLKTLNVNTDTLKGKQKTENEQKLFFALNVAIKDQKPKDISKLLILGKHLGVLSAADSHKGRYEKMLKEDLGNRIKDNKDIMSTAAAMLRLKALGISSEISEKDKTVFLRKISEKIDKYHKEGRPKEGVHLRKILSYISDEPKELTSQNIKQITKSLAANEDVDTGFAADATELARNLKKQGFTKQPEAAEEVSEEQPEVSAPKESSQEEKLSNAEEVSEGQLENVAVSKESSQEEEIPVAEEVSEEQPEVSAPKESSQEEKLKKAIEQSQDKNPNIRREGLLYLKDFYKQRLEYVQGELGKLEGGSEKENGEEERGSNEPVEAQTPVQQGWFRRLFSLKAWSKWWFKE